MDSQQLAPSFASSWSPEAYVKGVHEWLKKDEDNFIPVQGNFSEFFPLVQCEPHVSPERYAQLETHQGSPLEPQQRSPLVINQRSPHEVSPLTTGAYHLMEPSYLHNSPPSTSHHGPYVIQDQNTLLEPANDSYQPIDYYHPMFMQNPHYYGDFMPSTSCATTLSMNSSTTFQHSPMEGSMGISMNLPMGTSQVRMEPYAKKGKKPTGKNKVVPGTRHKDSVCSNCGTRETSLWRWNTDGHVECNACNIYEARNGQKRPVGLRKDRVLKRKRNPRLSNGNSAETTEKPQDWPFIHEEKPKKFMCVTSKQ